MDRRVAAPTILIATVVLSSTLAAAAPKPGRGTTKITFWAGDPGVEAETHSYTPPIAAASSSQVVDAAAPATLAKSQSSADTNVPAPVIVRPCFLGRDYELLHPVTKLAMCGPAEVSVADAEQGRRKRPAGPSPEQSSSLAADRAIALAAEPQLRLAPGRIGLTGLQSFFWLARAPQPITATAGAGGLIVTAEARPVQYRWSFGDGSEKVTEHSGRAWTERVPGDISHTYQTRGAYDLEVEVIWESRWRIGGGAWQHLGYFSNSDTATYPVREMVALLVRPR